MKTNFAHMLSTTTAKALSIGVTLFIVTLSVVAPQTIASLDAQIAADTDSEKSEKAEPQEQEPQEQEPTTRQEPTTTGGGSSTTKPNPKDESPEASCDTPTTEEGFRAIRDNMGRWDWDLENGSVTIRNNDENCSWPVGLKSFKIYSEQNPQNGQTRFDEDWATLAPGETRTFQVDVPSCRYQLDALIFPAMPYTSAKLIKGEINFDLPVCERQLEPPVCPFTPEDGTVVVFSQDSGTYLASTPASRHSIGPMHVTLPPGTYTVKTFSWDGYVGRENVTQIHEQWNVMLRDGAGTTTGLAGPTTDLADQVRQTTRTDIFTNAFTATATTTRIFALHAFPNDTSSANSVVPVCAAFKRTALPPAEPATLTVIKTVINDDGGTRQVSDFNLYVGTQNVTSGATNEFAPGTYTVREDNLPGYTASNWMGDCSATGQVTLAAGQHKICRITNNDNPPVPATITLIKTVLNDDGGTAEVSDFNLYIGNNAVQSGVPMQIGPGTYTAREDQLPGYTASDWMGDCSANGSVTVAAGEHKICRITNNDIPTEPQHATLTVIKTVLNDDGGTAEVSDFNLYVGTMQVTSGATNAFNPGTYTVREDQLPGYTASDWMGDCSADGEVTLVLGEHKICRITNNDNPFNPDDATLTVIKTVINDDGGTAQVEDFHLYVDELQVISGEENRFAPGTYTVHEANLPGYVASAWTGDCSADGQVTLASGQNKICRITNNDTPITNGETTITLIKTVINDDGGTAQVSDFNLYVGNTQVTSGNALSVTPGTYAVREDNLSGYTASGWTGDCSSDGSVTLASGDHKICRITNNDNAGGGGGGGGGGSSRRPRVTLFSNPEILGASISLSQVPYTGLGTSILQIILFLIGLVAIAGGVTYMLLRRRFPAAGIEIPMEHTPILKAQTHTAPAPRVAYDDLDVAVADEGQDELAVYGEYEHAFVAEETPRRTSMQVPTNLPVAPVAVASVVRQSPAARMVQEHREEKRQVAVSLGKLQNAARASQSIISEDGLKLVIASAEGNEQKALERLTAVIEVAKTRYPREDGWLVLDATRIRESLFISILSTVPLFIEWIVRGEDRNIFSFLRMLKSQNQPVADFIRKVVAELDNAHRARLEGASDVTVDPHVAEVTYHLSNRDLEMIVSELLSGVDERYDSAFTSVRLALVRVLDIVKSNHMTRIGGTYAFQEGSEA